MRALRDQSIRDSALLAISLCLIIAPIGPAWAQSHEGEPSAEGPLTEDEQDEMVERYSTVENITVTAERRETALERTPVSISAFTPRTIEELDINNIVNVSEFTPNLNIHTNAGGNTGATIGIRGAITSDPVVSLEPTVGIYLNGVYIGKAVGALFDMPDLAGLEVLRGPQGTLYGRNTIGGAITMNTIQPSGDWGLRQQFRAGNYRAFRTQTSLDIPVLGGDKGLATPDWLGDMNARITYQFEKRDGFYNNSADEYVMPAATLPPSHPGFTIPPAGTPIESGSNRLDDLNRESAIISVDWALPWDIQLDYVWDYHYAREVPSAFQSTYLYPGGGAPGSLGLDLSPWTTESRLSAVPNQEYLDVDFQPSDLESNLDISGHAINLSREQTIGFMGDVTLSAIVGIRSLDNSDAVDYDGSPYHIMDFSLDIEQDTVSFELQWVGEKDWEEAGMFDYVMGFYYYKEEGSALNDQLAFGFLGGLPAAEISFGANATESDFFFDNYSLAGYGQVTWTMPWLEERIGVTAGVRYTYEFRDMTRDYNCVMNANPADNGLCPTAPADFSDFTAQADKDFDDWAPMVNLTYQATDDAMVYFRAAKGFKAGGFNGRAVTESDFLSGYDPETLWSYEGGFKTTWLDQRLQLNVSGFYSDYSDMQVTIFEPTLQGNIITSVENAAEATIGGMELEMVAVPIDGLNIRLAYALLKPDYESYISGGVDVSNERNFVLAPENTISAGVGYTLPPFSFGTLGARLDVYWQDMVYFSVRDPSGANWQGSYTTLSGRVELGQIPLWGWGELAVAIWGRNLTDEEFKTFGIDWESGVGNVSSSFGKPRNYGFDVTYEF